MTEKSPKCPLKKPRMLQLFDLEFRGIHGKNEFLKKICFASVYCLALASKEQLCRMRTVFIQIVRVLWSIKTYKQKKYVLILVRDIPNTNAQMGSVCVCVCGGGGGGLSRRVRLKLDQKQQVCGHRTISEKFKLDPFPNLKYHQGRK